MGIETNAPLDVQLERITAISIENITLVEAHHISRADGGTVHEISFKGGGLASISYADDGAMRVFETKNLVINIQGGTIVTLRRSAQDSDYASI